MTLDSALKNRRLPLFCCCGVCGVMNCHLQPVRRISASWSFRAPQVMPAECGAVIYAVQISPLEELKCAFARLSFQNSPNWLALRLRRKRIGDIRHSNSKCGATT